MEKEVVFGMRARIALSEKGIDYNHREEDLFPGHDNKSELLLKMNPVHKKIPVLVHNGKPVCESLIIVQYIDEVWADRAHLMPSDPYQRAQARFWADYIDKKMIVMRNWIWTTKAEELEKAKAEFTEILKVLEDQALGDKPFFGGDEFGFVDVALLGYYCWFHALEMEGNFKVVESCPKIVAWSRHCMQRESVAKSLPDSGRIHEYLLDLKKKYGV